jgi:hypothetical protein
MSCHGLRKGAVFAALCGCVLSTVLFSMLATSARADAVNTQTVADAQCVVVGAQLSTSSDAEQRVAGQMILMYYLGRIDGRSPNTDLRTLIKNQTQRITESDFKKAASRCGKEFSARGEAIVQIGKSLATPAK